MGLFFCIFLCYTSSSATTGPVETMKPVLARLTVLLNDPTLQGDTHRDERRRQIMATIKSGFDFQEMCKRILGSTWRDID